VAKSIATIEGTALVPGISKNGRRYTKEAIAKAVGRLSERIADGTNPAVMLTSHGADDDSRCIIGRLSSMTLADDGSARFAAQIADTDEGRKIAALVDTRGGPAFLKGVSIRGAWLGKVRREVGDDGRPYEEAPDLEIDGLDFTRKPGVPGAQIDTFTPAGTGAPAESAPDGRVLITESAQEVLMTMISEDAEPVPEQPSVDEAATPPMSKRSSGLSGEGGPYADPGYLADKKQRYQIDTKAHAKAAWGYISQADNARQYTSAQLKRVKGRIIKALKGFGVTVSTAEGWLIDPATAVSESLAEYWDMPQSNSNLFVSLTNGPTTVTVSSTLLDAHDLDAVGRAAMQGAVDACMALDPDMDADIDVPGADDEDIDKDQHADEDDNDMADETNPPGSACSCGCGCAVPHPMAVGGGCPCTCGCGTCKSVKPASDADESAPAAAATPQTPAPEPAAATTETEVPAMAESTIPAAEAPAVDSGIDALSAKFDTLTNAITGLVTSLTAKPVEAAPVAAAPVAEAAPVVQETQEQMIARLVAEGVAAAMPAAVQEHVERNGVTRKGLVEPVNEHTAQVDAENEFGLPADWPNKPLHKYTQRERDAYVAPALERHALGRRSRV
jgi:hypothetical protein